LLDHTIHQTRSSNMVGPRFILTGHRGNRRRPGTAARRPRQSRLGLEALEGRRMLSATGLIEQRNLVSDQIGVAEVLDLNLVDPQGMGLSQASGPFWIVDNATGVATLYGGDVHGGALAKSPLVVKIPGGNPAGAVFNGTGDFVVTAPTGERAPA